MSNLDSTIFGCAGLSSIRTGFEANRLLRTAFELGISHFDTAPLYGKGYSEVLLGEFSQKVGRQNIVISSKFGLGNYPLPTIPASLALPLNFFKKKILNRNATSANSDYSPPQLQHRTVSAHDIQSSFERSLGRLKTDYLDYYFLHEGIPAFLTDEAKEFLVTLRNEGRINQLGLASNFYYIKQLPPPDVKIFDVLQYEASASPSGLKMQFPNLRHFGHTILKDFKKQEFPVQIKDHEKAGYLISQALDSPTFEKVLFSTRRIGRLKENIDAIKKY